MKTGCPSVGEFEDGKAGVRGWVGKTLIEAGEGGGIEGKKTNSQFIKYYIKAIGLG